jgi:hypothetical protein
MAVYFRVEVDKAAGLVRIVRTAEPMPKDTGEIRRIFESMAPEVRKVAGARLLIDLRGGPPGRNDEAFESASNDTTRGLDGLFARVAILVRTAAGKLQVRRMSSGARQVFQDEAEALRYLGA